MEHAATAANSSPPPETIALSRRGLGARGDEEAAGAARGSPRRAAGAGDAFVAMEAGAFVHEVGESDGEEARAEVEPAKQAIIDFLGVRRRDEDGRARAPMPDQYYPVGAAPGMGEGVGVRSSPAARPGAAGALDEDGVRALCQWNLQLLLPPSPMRCGVELAHAAADDDLSDGPASPEDYEGSLVIPDDAVEGSAATAGGAPDPSSGFGFFDLNQHPSNDMPEDEGFTVVPDNAVVGSGSAATADEDGSVESVRDATVRPSSSGFGFDLNQPCPSELPDGAPADPSRVPDPALPGPPEDSHAGPDADERPELPDGGAPAASQTRRQRSLSRLLDWALEWTDGLALGRGWKRSRR
jgi:hypothetical protein